MEKSIGMDEGQRQKDTGGYSTTVENVTGGTKQDWTDLDIGVEVGNENEGAAANKGKK